MLFFIAILIIGIALVNYVNLSVAFAPIRTKSITTQKVLGGSFSLSNRAKNTQKLLISFQFVISITLITGSLFVFLQNKYIGNVPVQIVGIFKDIHYESLYREIQPQVLWSKYMVAKFCI